MTDSTSKLAKLRTRLTAIKAELDNELLPLAECLGEEDDGLLLAMENLSERTAIYFDKHKPTGGESGDHHLK